MAAPVVSGTVALMLQANPTLTPNLIKAILQYTAQDVSGLQPAAAGRRLPEHARRRAARAVLRATRSRATACRSQRMWSQHIIWGNHLI